MKNIARTLACLATLMLGASAHAQEVKAGDLVITQPWSRATPAGAKVAGGYLTIENKGTTPDRLVSGTGDIAGKVEIHEMAMNNGVMTMRPLDKGLVIEPGKTVKLAPGGYHVMLMDLKGPLKEGDKVPMTLQFEKAGKVMLSLDVQGVGAQAPAGGRSFRHEEVEGQPMSKIAFAVIAVAALVGVSGRRACHPRETAGARRLVLQGGVRRAARLRGIGDGQAAGADSGRRDRHQADAQAGLDARDGQGQVRRRV